jgi:tetratricopeptide (TPR) repeat protein
MFSIRISSWLVAALLLVTPMIAGCNATGASPEAQECLSQYYVGNFGPAANAIAPLANKTDENYVLNNLRLGSCAIAANDWARAEKAFSQAYEVMNSAGVNSGARGAAAVIINEGMKVWKGEPYERAMCSFYLGVVYYQNLDYNNARACFENALFKLRDYSKDDKEEQYEELESDFIAAQVMLAQCWNKLGREDNADKILERAQRINPSIANRTTFSKAANVLLVVDFGEGPRKVTRYDNSVLAIGPTPEEAGPLPKPKVKVDAKNIGIAGDDTSLLDTLAMAQQRKWQSMDTVRIAKAAIGAGLMTAGAVRTATAEKEGHVWTGLGLMAAGALIKASGDADLRYWENLSRGVYVIPLELKPGVEHNITITLSSGHSKVLKNIYAPNQGDSLVYTRILR